MVTVVFYDPKTGQILNCSQLTQTNADASKYPYVYVKEYRMDYDSMYKVVDGELVPL